MPPAELTRTRASQDPAAEPKAPCLRGPHVVAEGHRADSGEPACPPRGRRSPGQRPAPGYRGRGLAAIHVAALWLRRALADSARSWALAAGAPPDLYH